MTSDDHRIDPARSACVLIGVDDYPDRGALRPLKAVRHNLDELEAVLRDEAIWGPPHDRLKVVPNPESQEELVDAIAEMAALAEDTLIVYYAGHGIRDPDDDQLYLTLPHSRHNAPHTAVPFEYVRREIRRSAARRRVVILDCCYSGRVLEDMASEELGVVAIGASLENIQGSYLMTSTAKDRRALAPDKNTCSVFTGALVDVVRQGIEDGPPYLGLTTIFTSVRTRLRKEGRPEPQEQDQNAIGELPFVRNRALAPAPSPASEPPRGLRRTVATGAICLVVGAAIPLGVWGWQVAFPWSPEGACSPYATLLSHSDDLDNEEQDGEKVEGLSALALTGGTTALALSDNEAARVFPIDMGPADDLSPTAGRATTFEDRNGRDIEANFDGEGLVLEPGRDTLLVSSEEGPEIRRFDRATGRQQGGRLPVPRNFRVGSGESQRGRTLEALAVSPSGTYLYAGMEAPLTPDGDDRGVNVVRIQRYKGSPGGAYELDKQFAYPTDPGLSLVELAAVGEERVLSLERQYLQGIGNVIKVFDVRLERAQDVSDEPALYEKGADRRVAKQELFNLAKCPAGRPGAVEARQPQPNPLLDNVEGMALGGPRPDGTRPLYLVSDNNGNTKSQITRLYAFALRLPR